MADWVLAKLSGEDGKLIAEAALQAATALETLIKHGADQAMAEYN
jgi:peptidyl-tRNA hydrolase